MLRDSIEERLRWFRPDYCEVSSHEVSVVETEPTGKAHVRCRVRGIAIAFNLHRKPFAALKQGSCADGIVLHHPDGNDWEINVIECKTSMKLSEWPHVKEQFEGAVLNGYALAGILGLPVPKRIRCWSAFQFDKLSSSHMATMPLVGGRPNVYSLHDWQRGHLAILSLDAVEHGRIIIDPVTKVGEVQL